MRWKGRELHRGGKMIGYIRQDDRGLWAAVLHGVQLTPSTDELSARDEVEQHLKFQDRSRRS